jgi:putative transposase
LVAEPFTETEDSAMTDEMMTLRALLEKSSDADLLREMIGFTAQRLMELEVESKTGAILRTRDQHSIRRDYPLAERCNRSGIRYLEIGVE